MGSFGKCSLCPKDSRSGLLIAGLCSYHFSDPKGKAERSIDPSKIKLLAAKEKTKTMKVWFDEQLRQAPKNCENCGKAIVIPKALPGKTKVCHILPKSIFKSVATAPLNRWFGCVDCHTFFDKQPEEKVALMPIIEVCKERLQTFKNEITETRDIPNYLK